MKKGFSLLDSYELILQGLDAEIPRHHELADILALHRDLLAVQASVEAPETMLAPDAGKVAEWLVRNDNVPFLVAEQLVLDVQSLLPVMMLITDTIERHREDLSDQVAASRQRLTAAQRNGGDVGLESMVRDALQNGWIPDEPGGQLDGDLLSFILRSALRPFLRARASAVSSVISRKEWRGNRCPVCHGFADMAVLSQDDGARKLLCGNCDTEWSYPRIGCPFCGDTARQFYYQGDDPSYRLYVCDACRRYLKTIDSRARSQSRPLAVERVLTAGMDMAALGIGYASMIDGGVPKE